MWQYQDWGQIIYLCANTNTRVLEHLCVCARADVYIYIYKILPGDMVLSVHIHVVWNGARIICDRAPDQYDSNVGFCLESKPH